MLLLKLLRLDPDRLLALLVLGSSVTVRVVRVVRLGDVAVVDTPTLAESRGRSEATLPAVGDVVLWRGDERSQ